MDNERINRTVAERMGLCWHETKGCYVTTDFICRHCDKPVGVRPLQAELQTTDRPRYEADNPSYLTNFNALFGADGPVEFLSEKGWMFTMMNWKYHGRKSYTAKFRETAAFPREIEERADTLNLAVCQAFLKATDATVKASEKQEKQ